MQCLSARCHRLLWICYYCLGYVALQAFTTARDPKGTCALQATPSSILHHLQHAKAAVMTPVVNAVSSGIQEEEEEGTEEPFGHDKMDPGKLPAKATLLMVLLWAIGLAVPFGVFREFFTKPLMIDFTFSDSEKGGGEEIQAVVGTRPDGLPELIPIVSHRKDLHSLLHGHRIRVQWPIKAGLRPRTLSCDPSGKVVVVADDLGVYVGEVAQEAETVRFHRVTRCVALEGQAIQDVSVACGDGPQASCRALAVNSGCMMGAFQANDEGCVVAGTSEGRIVELRESHIKNHTLVPERAMEQRNEALSAGSLHFSSKGYVMVLRRKSRSVQALRRAEYPRM
eukprot:Skav225226  [mRNA]  locus=scaffold2946:11392:33302:+ [translate_table: standard]